MIKKINAVMARKLIEAGGQMEIETIRLDGELAWRVNVHVPNDPRLYRVIVYHTMQDKYFKSLSSAFTYFQEMMPEGSTLSVRTLPAEEITTDD